MRLLSVCDLEYLTNKKIKCIKQIVYQKRIPWSTKYCLRVCKQILRKMSEINAHGADVTSFYYISYIFISQVCFIVLRGRNTSQWYSIDTCVLTSTVTYPSPIEFLPMPMLLFSSFKRDIFLSNIKHKSENYQDKTDFKNLFSQTNPQGNFF